MADSSVASNWYSTWRVLTRVPSGREVSDEPILPGWAFVVLSYALYAAQKVFILLQYAGYRLLVEIPLERIDPNPFNSRIHYRQFAIEKLCESLSKSGQLVPVRVRCSKLDKSRYELVCGQRRFESAKQLNWKTIRAEIVEMNDERMIEESLVENIQHEDLCDFEKAMVFDRMSKEFKKTYEEIGRIIGVTKQTVSNHISMLKLFDAEDVKRDPQLLDALRCVTEHHSRILQRVEDPVTRKNLIQMVARENLSVRDLQNVVTHLRSWFSASRKRTSDDNDVNIEEAKKWETSTVEERKKVLRVLEEECQRVNYGDFEGFEKLHLIGEGFTMFSAFPPFARYEGSHAVYKHREWFENFSTALKKQIDDVVVNMIGDIALVTLVATYTSVDKSSRIRFKSRGTVVLVKRSDDWKIFHEHYSRLDNTQESDAGLKLEAMLQLPSGRKRKNF
jgi:ParB family transcriptional regulator, chromosome partitioning protein